MRTVSIVIPSFNRYKSVIDCFSQVLNDGRIESVTIVDDCSTDNSYDKLKEYFKDEPKVKIFRNENNLDCYSNKHRAAELAVGEFICIWDSDNTFDKSYLDALYAIPGWDERTVYQPQFARPYFDFTKHAGLTLTKDNVAQYANTNLMTACNAMNFFINRKEYLEVWDGSVNPGSSDSLYFSYCWLNSGRKILITPNLEYDHFISNKGDGHYQTNFHKYIDFHEDLMNKLRNLK